uniref:Non-specific serine/threonine protein kinase n=1 Tax=Syphacia muris TaxID=451379 RepID=A0A0N5AKE5_9BILA
MTDADQDFLWQRFSSKVGHRPNMLITTGGHRTKPESKSLYTELTQNVQKLKRSFSEIRRRPSLIDYWIKRKCTKTDGRNFFHPFLSCNERDNANRMSKPSITNCTAWYQNGRQTVTDKCVARKIAGQTIQRSYSFKFPYEKKHLIERDIQQRISERVPTSRKKKVAENDKEKEHRNSAATSLLSTMTRLRKSTFKESSNSQSKNLLRLSITNSIKKCQSSAAVVNTANRKNQNLNNERYRCSSFAANGIVSGRNSHQNYEKPNCLYKESVNTANLSYRPCIKAKKHSTASSSPLCISTSSMSSMSTLSEELVNDKCYNNEVTKNNNKTGESLRIKSKSEYYPMRLKVDCDIRIPRAQLVDVHRSTSRHHKKSRCKRCRSVPEIIYNKNSEKRINSDYDDDDDSDNRNNVVFVNWNNDEVDINDSLSDDDDDEGNYYLDNDDSDSEEYGYDYEHDLSDTTKYVVGSSRKHSQNITCHTLIGIQEGKTASNLTGKSFLHQNDDNVWTNKQNYLQSSNDLIQCNQKTRANEESIKPHQASKFGYYSDAYDSDSLGNFNQCGLKKPVKRCSSSNWTINHCYTGFTHHTNDRCLEQRQKQQYYSLRQPRVQKICYSATTNENHRRNNHRDQLLKQKQQFDRNDDDINCCTSSETAELCTQLIVPLLKSKSWTGEKSRKSAPSTAAELPNRNVAEISVSASSPPQPKLQRTFSVRQVHATLNDFQRINLSDLNVSTKQLNSENRLHNLPSTVLKTAAAITNTAMESESEASSLLTATSLVEQKHRIDNSNVDYGEHIRLRKQSKNVEKMRRVHSLCDRNNEVIYRNLQLLGHSESFTADDSYHRHYRQQTNHCSRPLSITLPVSISIDDLAKIAQFPTQYEQDMLNVEYGPGIVQKLREKFTKLSRNLTSTARISRHLTRKRFPSVDDILCTSTANRHFQSVGSRHHRISEVPFFSRRDGSGPLLRSQTVLPIESFDISHSGSDSNFCQERIAAAARQTQGDKAAIDSAVTAESLDYEIMPIRALKEKFESYSRELVIPKTVDKNAKSAFRRNNRSHSATTRRSNMLMTRSYSLNDDDTDDDTAAFGSDDEPEFIRVQRRLKNSKRELHDRNLKVVSSKVDHRYTPDKKSSPAVTKPADVTLPKFSSSARLIVYPPTHIFEDAHSSPRPASILDLDNPPDPDSARASPLNQQNIQPEYTFSLSPNSGFDRSPPPEEPNPPECYTEKATETVYSPKTTESASYTKRANVECQDNAVLSKPQVPVDDGSGIEEMQKLLSKFNVIREQKNQSDTVVEASASPNTASATSPPQPVVVSSSSEKPLTKFVATKPKPRSTKAAFVTNIHSTFSTDSSELLRTRKSSLVAVPKPRDFLPQNTRVELLVHPKQSPLNEQLSGTNTETSLHHSPNSDAQTTKRNASIVTVTADDDSALRSSPRQLLLSQRRNVAEAERAKERVLLKEGFALSRCKFFLAHIGGFSSAAAAAMFEIIEIAYEIWKQY